MTHVTIAGGGLAGLSAALRLAERGYRVKLYESKDVLGGNVASRHVGERVWLDVYPHMYLNWYHNFWALLADVTDADREQLFRPMEGVQWLRAGTYPRFRGLKNPYRPRNLLRNLIDGPAPAADLYLFLYASIDLMAERLNPTLRLGDVSVNGFLRARPYMTERTAEFFDGLIVDIWGIPSYLAAADDYQEFLEYSVADPSPPFWLARGSGHDQVLAPLEAKLRALGVEIELATQLVSASCAKGRVTEIGLRDADGETRTEDGRRAPAGVAARGPVAHRATRRSADREGVTPDRRGGAAERAARSADPRLLQAAPAGPRRADRAVGLLARSRLHGHLADVGPRAGLRRRRDGARALLVGPVRAPGHRRAG